VFDLQNSKYWTEQYKTEQGKIRQDKIALVRERDIIFLIFENKMGIFVFFIVVHGQKVVPWFNEGQKFLFLSYPFLPILSSTITSF
jgi:hypothetical protein